MVRLLHELQKLNKEGWVVDDANIELQRMIPQFRGLQYIPATQRVLRKPSIKVLYTSICGALQPLDANGLQDLTHVSLTACYALEETLIRFLQAREEIQDAYKELYPYLWELKSRPHDAVLNGLPDMPRSSQQLIQALKDTGAPEGTPVGRLPMGAQAKPMFLRHSFYFVRVLISVELPNNPGMTKLPIAAQHTQLIAKVVQNRSDVAEARAAQPVTITAGDVKEVLQEFSNDPFSRYANKRWLWDVLKVPKQHRQDPEHLPQALETAVDEFIQDVPANVFTRLALSKHTLAMITLYHRILNIWKAKSHEPMLVGPIFRMLEIMNLSP
jgi:hypothetical protein